MLEIMKGRTEFLYGMSSGEQLKEWLEANPTAQGLAMVGRSNVGKSSLINSLFGKKIARTSNTPGRTREINIFRFHLGEKGIENEQMAPLYLFDLPGYGYAEVSKDMSDKWEELMSVFFTRLSHYVGLINLQDARHPNQKSDLAFQDFIRNYGHETFLVFNKLDKLKTQKERAALEKLKPEIFKSLKWVKQIHFVSAESNQGLPSLHDALINFLVLKNQTHRELN